MEAFAFTGCENLESITLSSKIDTIENNTFANCSKLTTILNWDSICIIKYRAFKNCTSLTSIVLPFELFNIEKEAFAGCKGLTDVEFPKYSKWRIIVDDTTYSVRISNPSTNATNLKDAYSKYEWKKSENSQ